VTLCVLPFRRLRQNRQNGLVESRSYFRGHDPCSCPATVTRNEDGIGLAVEGKMHFCDMALMVTVEVLCLNRVVFICTQIVLASSNTSDPSLMPHVIDISVFNKGWNV
jgi:hypothetical protein